MDKRSVYALLLIFAVIVGGNLISNALWPKPKVAPADTIAVANPATVTAAQPRDSVSGIGPATTQRDSTAPRQATGAAPLATVRPETTTVAGTGREIRFVTPGAVPAGITLTEYPDLKRKDGMLALQPTNGQLLRYRIVNGADTIHLDRVAFTRTQTARGIEFVSAAPA